MTQYSMFSEEDFRKDTRLDGRVVCILGRFRQPQKVLQQLFSSFGADCRSAVKVSRNVHYVLVGQDAPTEQTEYLRTLEFNGYRPRILYQKDIDSILQGHLNEYMVPKVISKDLRLGIRHYEMFRLNYGSAANPLYTRELFVAADTETPQSVLYQKLGDRGVYANSYIDDTTDVLVVSDKTLECLRKGERDTTARFIENVYNNSKAQNYRYVMTGESELLEWLGHV